MSIQESVDKSVNIMDINSEAGIVASIILKPELTFYSEQLLPNHFVDTQNAYIYYAVCELVKRGIENIDAYNINHILSLKEATKKQAEIITIQALNELFDNAKNIARTTVEEYKMLVSKVLDAAFRRYTYQKLSECQQLCLDTLTDNIEQKIYSELDNVMTSFSSKSEIPQYKDVVDEMWGEIEKRQNNGIIGIPFKFPTLNEHASIERGELFLFAGNAKQGKSMMLLNCAVDVLKQNKSVLYIDSELSTRMYTCRLLSHITGIDFKRLKSGTYGDEEKTKIDEALYMIKNEWKFTHLYMPMFDAQSIYTAVKKVYHTQGLDVLIIDYFKGRGEGDAFCSYQELGRLVDMVKNQICGDMDIAGIGAVQATDTGRIADSQKIVRNASTIALIQDKTQEEIMNDGLECGNKKLRICYNRNGEQHISPEQYIDLRFNGNKISFEEAKQHSPDISIPF